MGLYVTKKLSNLNKAHQLITKFNARVCATIPPFYSVPPHLILISVVENGPYDAAGVIYDEIEYNTKINLIDDRKRTWLLMRRDIVQKLVANGVIPRSGEPCHLHKKVNKYDRSKRT